MIIGATAAYTYAFRGTNIRLEDYLASIETLPRLGIHHFDLEILQPQHIEIYGSSENLRTLQNTLSAHSVHIAGFTAWACLTLIHSNDPDKHERGYELFSEIAQIAARLNAQYIHLGSDMIGEYITVRDESYVTAPATEFALPEDVPLSGVLDAYATRLNRLAQIAQDNDLRFACEPRANSLIHSADGFLDLYRRAPHENWYCCLDVMHAAYHRENVALAIEKLGEKLLVLQLCNAHNGELNHYPLGDGEIETTPILRALRKINFQNFLMLEIYRGGQDEKSVVDSWYADGIKRLEGV
jgi:sugar phosphate isomerase/epimerase